MKMLGVYPAVILPDSAEYEHSSSYLSEVLGRAARVVGKDEIHSSPKAFFLQNSYENILELFDLPSKGARYYHLYGVPLVKGARDYQNMQRVLKLTGAEYASFANLYCYNHAYPNNLLYMAEKIRARNLIGVHSSNPEMLVTQYSRQVLPQKGEVYILSDGNLTPKDY